MKTIFNTCVKVTSEKQAYRFFKICVENKLPYWDDVIAFRFDGVDVVPTFEHSVAGFAIFNSGPIIEKVIVTESEWLELLDEHNKN